MEIQTALPGYWTPGEVAMWLGVTGRTIHHKLKGRGEKGRTLFGYDVGIWLIPDKEAVRFIAEYLRSQGEEGETRLALFQKALSQRSGEEGYVLALSENVAVAS